MHPVRLLHVGKRGSRREGSRSDAEAPYSLAGKTKPLVCDRLARSAFSSLLESRSLDQLEKPRRSLNPTEETIRVQIIFPCCVDDAQQTLCFGARVSPNSVDLQWFQVDVATALDANHETRAGKPRPVWPLSRGIF